MTRFKMLAATAVATGSIFAATAAPAADAQPVITGGLVNITVVDLLNNNQVLDNNNVNLGVALTLAANVCDTTVNVLATQVGTGAPVSCDNGAQRATITQLAG
jgi:hypothetical protein